MLVWTFITFTQKLSFIFGFLLQEKERLWWMFMHCSKLNNFMLLFYNITQKPTSWGKLCDCWSTFCEKYDCIQLRQFQVWNSNTKQKAEKKVPKECLLCTFLEFTEHTRVNFTHFCGSICTPPWLIINSKGETLIGMERF